MPRLLQAVSKFGRIFIHRTKMKVSDSVDTSGLNDRVRPLDRNAVF